MPDTKRRLTRKVAYTRLKEFVGRVWKANANTDFLFTITAAYVVGDYLDTSLDKINHVAIGLARGNRHEDMNEYIRKYNERIEQCGRSFPNMEEQANWPWTEVVRFLRGGSTALYLFDLGGIDPVGGIKRGLRYRQVFPTTVGNVVEGEATGRIPEDLKGYLGDYGVVLKDSYCGEPIAWGHKIVRRVGKETWKRLGELGDLECIKTGDWVLVKRWITPEEIVEKHGQPTKIITGPRGGFKQIVYGETTFLSRKAVPENKSHIPVEIMR